MGTLLNDRPVLHSFYAFAFYILKHGIIAFITMLL